MMTRQILLQAAAFIEKNPNRFDFINSVIPYDAGPYTPTNDPDAPTGCALGWLHFFSGRRSRRFWPRSISASRMLGITDHVFYLRLSLLEDDADRSWQLCPLVTAKVLRRYADLHFPEIRLPEPEQNRELSYA